MRSIAAAGSKFEEKCRLDIPYALRQDADEYSFAPAPPGLLRKQQDVKLFIPAITDTE